jgi:hypothetical protein
MPNPLPYNRGFIAGDTAGYPAASLNPTSRYIVSLVTPQCEDHAWCFAPNDRPGHQSLGLNEGPARIRYCELRFRRNPPSPGAEAPCRHITYPQCICAGRV